MLERGKISALQLWMIMYPTILSTVILLVPAITAGHAGRDLWISPLWASIIGIVTVWVACRLHELYPGQTLIEYSERILGRWAGKAVAAMYLFFLLHMSGIILREYGDFVVGSFLNQTPISVVIGTMLLVCAFNVRGGLEVVGRTAQIFVPIVLLLFLGVFILLIPDLDPRQLQPVLEFGLWPGVKGAFVPSGWFSEFIVIVFLLPYLSNREKGMKAGLLAVLAVLGTMVMTNAAAFSLFGETTSTYVYPVMVAARYISFADFFEHLEALVMLIWVGGTFVKISMFYYAAVLGTAQWLGLSDYRPITLPIGFLLLLLGIWAAPGLPELVHFLDVISPFYFVTVQTAIPVLLLGLACLRKRAGASKGEQGA